MLLVYGRGEELGEGRGTGQRQLAAVKLALPAPIHKIYSAVYARYTGLRLSCLPKAKHRLLNSNGYGLRLSYGGWHAEYDVIGLTVNSFGHNNK